MAAAKPRGRPNYGGKCATLYKKILLQNHGKDLDMNQILKKAKVTHGKFYEEQFKTLDQIATEAASRRK